MHPAPNFQQVLGAVFQLPASVVGQMQFPLTLTTCSHGRREHLPKTSILAWKGSGISALLGSRFATVNQSSFCCSSWEPRAAKAQAATGQEKTKKRALYTSSPLSANKSHKPELRGCFPSGSHVPSLTLPS